MGDAVDEPSERILESHRFLLQWKVVKFYLDQIGFYGSGNC